MLLSVASDVSRVAARHAPALRSAGLDEIAERLEELVRALAAGAQELEAAMQELPQQVAPR
jgi:hypothetical protein